MREGEFVWSLADSPLLPLCFSRRMGVSGSGGGGTPGACENAHHLGGHTGMSAESGKKEEREVIRGRQGSGAALVCL